LVSQQASNCFILIYNQVLNYFIGINNFYAALEFMKRNKAKINILSKTSSDSEQSQMFYQQAVVLANSGQYDLALLSIRNNLALNDYCD
jgi:hypothetical protein